MHVAQQWEQLQDGNPGALTRSNTDLELVMRHVADYTTADEMKPRVVIKTARRLTRWRRPDDRRARKKQLDRVKQG